MVVDVLANRTLFRARPFWKFEHQPQTSDSMTRTGNAATYTVKVFSQPSVTWWVRVTATDGSVYTSSKKVEDNPCV
jgi:hypothetical protein